MFRLVEIRIAGPYLGTGYEVKAVRESQTYPVVLSECKTLASATRWAKAYLTRTNNSDVPIYLDWTNVVGHPEMDERWHIDDLTKYHGGR